ncbi:MAG: penicillin-binding protein 2 [Nitrospirota bacterium]|nr:penicillin-binding protein 2 [Nitrospirota bacterium]
MEDLSGKREKSQRARIFVLFCTVCFLFFAAIARLFYLQIVDHSSLSLRAEKQHQKSVSIESKRGAIYDRQGRELAVSIDVESVYGVPVDIKDARDFAAKLAPILKMSRREILDKLEGRKNFAWLARKVDRATADKIRALNIKGVGFVSESKRFYPKGTLASFVLGFTGMDNQGLEGLERTYDKYVSGSSGWLMVERDALGRSVFPEGLNYQAPAPGGELVLTLDEVIQYISEKELDNVVSKYHPKSAAVIVVDPRTGEILAMAARPDFNPDDRYGKDPSHWRNWAISDQYEPGSTFKMVMASAALSEKVVGVSERFDCSAGVIKVGGSMMHDAHKSGVLTFTEVIQKSSNVGSIMVGMRLGPEKYYKYIRDFGFGERTGVDLPGETSGMVLKPSRWSGTSIGAISIGQEVGVTPLQILMATSAIANGGNLMRPYLVSEVRDAEGNVIKKTEPTVVRQVISEKVAQKMTQILKTVSEEGGTATSARIQEFEVAGKTGTAQKIDPVSKRYSSHLYVSSFVGYVPADDPRLAIIVVVNEPKGAIYGGVVAAPAFRNIADQALTYLNVPSANKERFLLVSN